MWMLLWLGLNLPSAICFLSSQCVLCSHFLFSCHRLDGVMLYSSASPLRLGHSLHLSVVFLTCSLQCLRHVSSTDPVCSQVTWGHRPHPGTSSVHPSSCRDVIVNVLLLRAVNPRIWNWICFRPSVIFLKELHNRNINVIPISGPHPLCRSGFKMVPCSFCFEYLF